MATLSRRTVIALIVALALVVMAVIAMLWWQRRPAPLQAARPAPPPAAEPAASAIVVTPPAIQYPVAASAATASLPPLDQADSVVKTALAELLGSKAVLSLLQTDGFVRRLVATVDNLPRAQASTRLWPANPAPGRFTTARVGDGEVIGADNSQRYTAFVRFAEAVDTARAVALYTQLYPLFQQAYEELGYPGRHFNDRVVAVIDHLLAAPEPAGPLKLQLTEVKGPIQPTRPWVHYEFTEPALESLSSGQKLMVRVGPENERRLKAKLVELRRVIIAGSTAPR